MARKFNIGRQGEQLLNEEFHNLFMSLKYLNYDRYKNIENPIPERQAAIPDHALRLRLNEDNINILETYYPDLGDGEWKTLFENYFHPINTMRPTGNEFAPYRLCIDPKSGAIMYWDPDVNSWIPARANDLHGDVSVFIGMNFQIINDLQPAQRIEGTEIEDLEYYPVPFVNYGRLFSRQEDGAKIIAPGRYVQPDGVNYIAVNETSVNPNESLEGPLSWVHVNASKVTKIDKRLIKIQKDTTVPDYNFIKISPKFTEYYGFHAGNREGTLLLKNQDYTEEVGGIKLLDVEKYDYLYTLSYTFDDYPSNEGYVLIDFDVVGENNQVYIGQVEGADIALFMDGLALERTDEEENDIYIYDEAEGTVTFTDDEDAEIIKDMQMTALVFPKRSKEFLIDMHGTNTVINKSKKTVTITIDGGNNMSQYKNPILFCSGLGLQETELFKDITINGNQITIHNFVYPIDERLNPVAGLDVYKGFIADVENSYVCEGKLQNGKIVNENIKEGELYVVFCNGILMTPTNGDIRVENGKIAILKADEENFGEVEYTLFSINNDVDDQIGLLFDETVSYYSVRIDDNGKEAVYNDCSSAIVYIENGIILDQSAIERASHTVDGFFKDGQIVRTSDDYGNVVYYIYDRINTAPRELTTEEKEEVEHLIGYYTTPGSIHLLGNNDSWTGCDISYYAYSYANMIDEPMIDGRKTDLMIPVGKGDITYKGKVSRFDAWKVKNNSLTTYINGLIVDNDEIDDDSDGLARDYEITYPKMYIPTDENYYGQGVDIVDVLNRLYKTYNGKLLSEVDIYNDVVDEESNEPISKYFASHSLFVSAFELGRYINVDMQNESTSYVIEEIERDEFMAVERDFINLETGDETNHGQIYTGANDTVQTDWPLAPSTVHVYVNGMMLDSTEYIRFNNNKIMFNVDVCGLQQLPKNKMICLPEHILEKPHEVAELERLYETKQVIRIIEDKPYYIPTSSRDTILIEKRADTSIRVVTYDVLSVSYGTLDFTQDFYDIPETLVTSADLIKIYINGVRYEGEYTTTASNGARGIKLLDPDALKIDPLYQHFLRFPDEAEKYEQTYGKAYERQIDRITFEWR